MITPPKDLRTGQTIWSSYRVPRVPVSALTHDQKCDVVVVGAGISGAMIAQELAEAGLSVIILDRRKPIYGSTFASTALLQYELDIPLIKLGEKIGAENAARAWQRSKLGLESLATKIRTLDIDCDYERCNSLYLSGSLLDAQELKHEQYLRKSIGLETNYLSQKQLRDQFDIGRKAALCSYDNISVNPVQLTAGFLLDAIKRGAKVYSPVNAIDIKSHETSVHIITEKGPSITARYAVFATGYEIPKQIHTKQHAIYSTWAIATKPQVKNMCPNHPFIWEASDPYLYIKVTSDNRIICGGEDETFSNDTKRDALIAKKTLRLQNKLKKLLPAIDAEAAFAWAGSFGASTTGLPSIGSMPHTKNCFAVMAYGGNGITFSRIAAELIRNEILNQTDPDRALFAFHNN